HPRPRQQRLRQLHPGRGQHQSPHRGGEHQLRGQLHPHGGGPPHHHRQLRRRRQPPELRGAHVGARVKAPDRLRAPVHAGDGAARHPPQLHGSGHRHPAHRGHHPQQPHSLPTRRSSDLLRQLHPGRGQHQSPHHGGEHQLRGQLHPHGGGPPHHHRQLRRRRQPPGQLGGLRGDRPQARDQHGGQMHAGGGAGVQPQQLHRDGDRQHADLGHRAQRHGQLHRRPRHHRLPYPPPCRSQHQSPHRGGEHQLRGQLHLHGGGPPHHHGQLQRRRHSLGQYRYNDGDRDP